MKQLGAYGNVTKTNLLINEFMKGRQNNLKAEEELIVNDVKDYINQGSFVEQSRQKCKNLFMSVSFRDSRIMWKEIDEVTMGPAYYPTDFGSCCLLIPHFDLKPINESLSLEEMYHVITAIAINGEENGVDIVLNAEQFNYADHHSRAAGFKISIHNHLDKPIIQFSSQLIFPGTDTQINLKPVITNTTLDAINKFSPEVRNCYADGEANLTYLKYGDGYRYEMNNCLVDQGIRDIIWNCRCIPSFYEMNDDYLPFIPICSGEKLYCANTRFPIDFKNNIIVQEAKDNPDKIGNISKPEYINCMPACEVQDNNNQMSLAPYPQHRNFFYQQEFCEVASHIWQKTCQDENRAYFIDKDQPILCPLLHQFDEFFGNQSMKCEEWPSNYFKKFEHPNETLREEMYEYGRQNLALIHVMIQSPYVTKIKRDVAIPFVTFISNTGGLLGLCIGFSFISGIEVLFWICWCCRDLKK